MGVVLGGGDEKASSLVFLCPVVMDRVGDIDFDCRSLLVACGDVIMTWKSYPSLLELLARDIADYERIYKITLSMDQLSDYTPTGHVFLGHPVFAHKDVPRPIPMRGEKT